MLYLLVRRLARSKAFIAYVGGFLSVALASYIGLAQTAMAVFAEAVPGVRDGARVMRIAAPRAQGPFPVWSMSFSRPELEVIRDVARSQVADVAGYGPIRLAVGRSPTLRAVSGDAVTSEYFNVLGATAAAGTIVWSTKREQGVVISEVLARTIAASSSEAVGMALRLNGVTWNVQGVVRAFRGLEEEPSDVFVPVEDLHQLSVPESWIGAGSKWLRLVTRVPLGVAAADMRTRLISTLQGEPVDFLTARITLEPLNIARGIERSRREVVVLVASATAVTLLILLITNLGQLFLLRWLSRAHEFAVHGALGATSMRLAALAAGEPLSVCALGAVGGVLGGRAFFRSTSLLALRGRDAGYGFGWTGAAVLGALALTILLVAILPVIVTAFKSRSFGTLNAARDGSRRFGHVLEWTLAVQVFITTVAITITTVSADSLSRITESQFGFDADHLYAIAPLLSMVSPRNAAMIQMAENLRATDGVESVSLSGTVPTRTLSMSRIYVRGRRGAVTEFDAEVYAVDSAFFATTGIERRIGHDATPIPWSSRSGAMVMSLAADSLRRSVQSPEPCVRLGGPDAPCRAVIGTAKEARFRSLFGVSARTVYVPFDTDATRQTAILVRSLRAPGEVVSLLERVVARNQDERAPVDVRWIRGSLDAISAPWRAGLRLMQTFCAIAIVIAAVGVASVSLRTVRARRRDIGIMLALGASRGRVARTILTRATLVTLSALTAACMGGAIGIHRIAPLIMLSAETTYMRSLALAAAVSLISVLVGLALPLFQMLSIQPIESLNQSS
ncbi:MAG: permease [Gemmatimonadetes bacterium]|nr:permease [Gemmatimonadota bacterium]